MNPNTRTTPIPVPMRLSKAIATTTALAATVVLAGCASSLSGVGGTEGYACKAPIGAQCTSVSGVYANAAPMAHRAVYEALRQQQAQLATSPVASLSPKSPPGASMPPAFGPSTGIASPATPAALRSPPRVVRLWIAPWEDADGDLHDASFVHVVVDTGRWLIERVRPAPRFRLDIAKPPIATPVAPNIAPSTAPAQDTEAMSPADLSPTEP